MKAWIYIIFFMITSCSHNPNSQNLTWYNNSTINQVTEDPENPEKFQRVTIGISQQVFYLSKKDPDYQILLEKLNQSAKEGKAFNIGIENNTNIIRQVNEIK
ncbi:hypothetical protein BCF58_1882 [Chryseobacterium defluvii]|uniref:Uncharacterized protein n=2 Tax=Chryseobacterium defluvii TaxID=160396 RepID=A0A495SDR1_9FLAO|nr:hypothetical protein BCF58_1882 [Chryseobacterium defluvii]